MKKFTVFLCTMLLSFGMVGVAAAIPIDNSTFNDPPGAGDTGWTWGAPTAWDFAGQVGVFNPWVYDSTTYSGHDGSDVALVYSHGGGLGQWLLGESPADGMMYTLTVDAAGRIGLTGTGATYALAFVAGQSGNLANNVTLGTSEAFTPTEGDFNPAQFEYTYTAADYDPIYSVLGINLLVYGASESNQVLFDNVSLSAAPIPEPATMLLVGSGLIGLAAIRRKKFLKKT